MPADQHLQAIMNVLGVTSPEEAIVKVAMLKAASDYEDLMVKSGRWRECGGCKQRVNEALNNIKRWQRTPYAFPADALKPLEGVGDDRKG